MTTFNGIALRCDQHGNIQQVLRDHHRIGITEFYGAPVTRLVVRGELGKMLSFLVEVKENRIATQWEINLQCSNGASTYHFAGVTIDGSLFVIASEGKDVSLSDFKHSFSLDADQAACLEQLWNTRNPSQPSLDAVNNDLFDEISRLNNELVNMQRQITKKNAELARLNQEKNRFLGMAAHDLRTPLHSILAASEYLLGEDPTGLGETYQDFMSAIHHSSQFMSNLVDDLLDVSTIESGNLRLDLGPVDLPRLLEDNIVINQAIANKKQIELRLHADRLPTVVLDAAKFEQVLNNLISNAVKFSQPGSKIDIRMIDEGPTFLLEVQDYGLGMDAHELARLFKPLARGRPGTQGERSTGLGLLIVKRIVSGHGGQIEVQSQAGAGTTFSVRIHRNVETP